jgi:hypothetical protein
MFQPQLCFNYFFLVKIKNVAKNILPMQFLTLYLSCDGILYLSETFSQHL